MKLNLRGLFAVAAFLLGLLGSTSAFAESKVNLDKSGIALQGYDPVSYFKLSGPQKGDPKMSTTFDGATYFFVSEPNRIEFLKEPKKYLPQFGGWCAYAVADSGSKVEVDPKSFLIQDGRLLLFFKGFFADTRQKWQKNPEKYLKTADGNWPAVEKKDP